MFGVINERERILTHNYACVVCQVFTATKKEGWNGHENAEPQWSFTGALLYSVTVITTIGLILILLMKLTRSTTLMLHKTKLIALCCRASFNILSNCGRNEEILFMF